MKKIMFTVVLSLSLLFLLTGSAFAQANVFYSSFEKDHDTWKWYTHGRGELRTGALSEEFSRKGKHSAKFVMGRTFGGVFWRAMFRKEDGFKTGRQDERWIGFSTYFPNSGADAFESDKLAELIFQLHNNKKVSPIFGLYIKNGLMDIHYRWSDIDPLIQSDQKTKIISVGKAVQGEWVDWVFHLKLSPLKAEGIVEVWSRTAGGEYTKVVNEHNVRFGYNTPTAPAIDIGLYKWPWKKAVWKGVKSPINRRVVYFDEIRIANETGGFKDVSLD